MCECKKNDKCQVWLFVYMETENTSRNNSVSHEVDLGVIRSVKWSVSTCQDVSGTVQSSEILNHQAPRCPGGQKENLFCSSPLLASVCQLLHPLLSALVSKVCMLIILLDCLVPGGAGFCLRCNHFWTWRRQNWQYLGWKQPRLNFSGLRWPLPHNLEKFNTHLA